MNSLFRDMRIILFYDLPSIEFSQKKEYTNFRRSLIKNGFIMIQFSVYVKAINTKQKIKAEVEKLKKFLPSEGNIRIITVTEFQYKNMIFLVGNKKINEIYNNSERYVKI